jgi:hypothetical protein
LERRDKLLPHQSPYAAKGAIGNVPATFQAKKKKKKKKVSISSSQSLMQVRKKEKSPQLPKNKFIFNGKAIYRACVDRKCRVALYS